VLRAQPDPTCHPEPFHSAGAEPEGRNDRCAGQVQVTCHPERRVGVRKGAKDRRAARGSAPGFVRRSFAPARAPALSLRMTGWVVLDSRRRTPANPHKTYEFLGSERVGAGVGAKDLRASRGAGPWTARRSFAPFRTPAHRFQETPSVHAGFRAGGAAANSRWWSTATPPERHHRKGLHAGGVLVCPAPLPGRILADPQPVVSLHALPPAIRRRAFGAHPAWGRLRAVSSLRFSARAVQG